MIERQHICPQCKGPLERITQSPDSPLNRDQWEAVVAGKWICRSCPSNDRGQQPLCYWHDHELLPVHDFQI